MLGANFPRYLAESRLHAVSPPPNSTPTWPEFVFELATLERALYEVYDGPGTEQSGMLSATEVAQIPPAKWADLRLVAAPCLRLHVFAHPVHEFWMARKDGGKPAACEPRPTWLAINRRNYLVERHELSEAEFLLLTRLVGGATLEEAVRATIESLPAGASSIESQISGWFARFARDGYFSSLAEP
jgi:hypothetical protein